VGGEGRREVRGQAGGRGGGRDGGDESSRMPRTPCPDAIRDMPSEGGEEAEVTSRAMGGSSD
jgi:hypothetical protein